MFPRDFVSTLEIGGNKLLNETKLVFSPHLNVISMILFSQSDRNGKENNF